jgi:hypothetical protein
MFLQRLCHRYANRKFKNYFKSSALPAVLTPNHSQHSQIAGSDFKTWTSTFGNFNCKTLWF